MDLLPPTPVFVFGASVFALNAFIATYCPEVVAAINPWYSVEQVKNKRWLCWLGSVAMLVAGAIVALIRSLG